jgi:hypothetical protein
MVQRRQLPVDDGRRDPVGRYPLRSPGIYYGTPYQLAGIAAASPRYVAFLYPGTGSHGQLLRTTDAGRTWSPVRF